MSFSNFINVHGVKVQKVHYLHLIQIAQADGKIDDKEKEILHKEGKRFGLSDSEIDKLIAEEKEHHYHPPYSLDEKFEDLYYVARMILADDEISESEMKLLTRFAVEVGFDNRAIEILKDVLISGVRNNDPEEKILKKFRQELFS